VSYCILKIKLNDEDYVCMYLERRERICVRSGCVGVDRLKGEVSETVVSSAELLLLRGD
jgi:hypothetical protein